MAQHGARRVARARGRSDIVAHHDTHYGGRLPIWALMELLDFSDVSRLYQGLHSRNQWEIAEKLGVRIGLDTLSKNQRVKALKHHPLVRWLEQLTQVRNTSAHHARLWNKRFPTVGTGLMRTSPGLEALPETDSERIYGAFCLIMVLLETASPNSSWRLKVRSLVENEFGSLKGRAVAELGFPGGWQNYSLWTVKF
ncbi:Abi family protein [Leucobacter sp. HY1910]